MSSNDRFNVTTDGRMLPALLNAMMIARTTAVMSGSPGIAAGFKAMLADLAGQCGIPDLHTHVDDDDWFEACRAIARAKSYHWFTKTDWSGSNGEAMLIVDGCPYRLDGHLDAGNPHLPAIQEFLERYAHVAAVKGAPTSDWRPYEPPGDAVRADAGEAPAP